MDNSELAVAIFFANASRLFLPLFRRRRYNRRQTFGRWRLQAFREKTDCAIAAFMINTEQSDCGRLSAVWAAEPIPTFAQQETGTARLRCRPGLLTLTDHCILLLSRSQLGRERILMLETIPMAAYIVTIEEPPALIKGSVNPTTGKI